MVCRKEAIYEGEMLVTGWAFMRINDSPETKGCSTVQLWVSGPLFVNIPKNVGYAHEHRPYNNTTINTIDIPSPVLMYLQFNESWV